MSEQDAATPWRAQVVGLGLIGSSVALALRARGWHVTGSDLNAERARRAIELGVVDAIGEEHAALLAVVATPVATIAEIVEKLVAQSDRDDLVVTDVGSVKGPITAAIESRRFVGGHPMAGSEQEGPDGADPELFVGATWVLTPTSVTEPAAFELVRSIVSDLGAEVVALEPERHDALVAVVSHVPHLAAANLMALAADASIEHAALLRLAAGGFRDMTRIAAGEPAIWPDIFRDNAAAVLVVLDNLLERLTDEARRIVAAGDRDALLGLLEYAKSARRNLPSRVLRPESITECRIPVTDRPGELAEVTAILGGIGVNIWDIEIAHSSEGVRGVLVVSISSESSEQARAALDAQRLSTLDAVARVSPSRPVVAIDGPGGSGKSTVARFVAKLLGLEWLDTGAMYRVATLKALSLGVALDDEAALGRLTKDLALEVGERVVADGEDVTEAIRTRAVDAAVSEVAAHPSVRRVLVTRQRAWVRAHDGGVVEGRDIGSVVLPDADVRVYLTASEDERARRRSLEEQAKGEEVEMLETKEAIARRDQLDSARAVSPLVVAQGAVVIDSTDRSPSAIAEEIVALVQQARDQ